MISLFLRLFFGADAMLEHAVKMFQLRKQATERHTRNKELAAELAEGQEALATIKTQYAWVKADLEAAYRLELE